MKIYTDGSSKGNPGPGGFGVVVVDDNNKILYAHSKMSDGDTTNNEQELLAILFAALRYGREEPVPDVYTDSAYAANCLTDWMYRWEKNNWLKSDDKKPENLDAIQAYYNFCQIGYKINIHKIKGHSGNKWNELADKLATGKITPEDAVK